MESPRAQAMDAEPTVFLVDDDEQVRDWLRATVESVKLPIQTYKSARDFLDSYGPASPGCLVADMRLPGMSGLDVIEALREEFEDAKIIGISAGAKDFPPVKRMQGADHVFSKPIDREILLRVVNRLLSTKNAP